MRQLDSIPDNTVEKIDLLLQTSRSFLYTKPQQSVDLSLRALATSEYLENEKKIAESLSTLGGASWSLGKLSEALSYFERSEDLANELRDNPLILANLNGKGVIYAAAGSYNIAVSYYKKARPLIPPEDIRMRAVNLNNLAYSFTELAQFDSAKAAMVEAIALVRDPLPQYVGVMQYNLAKALYGNKDFVNAEIVLREGLEYSGRFNDKRGVILNSYLLADIASKNQRCTEALTLADTASQLAGQTELLDLKFYCFDALSRAHACAQEYGDAFNYQNRARAYKDSLQNQFIQRRLDLYEYEKNRRELLALRAENRRQQDRTTYLIIFLGIAVVVIFVSFQLQRVLNRKNKELELQTAKLDKANRFKSKLFSMVSHDVRSPLNTIDGFLRLLSNEKISTADFQQFLPDIGANLQSTRFMLENLLDWVKSQMLGDKIQYERFQLKEIAEENINLFQDSWKKKDLKIQLDLPGKHEVFADKNAVRLVLRNLLSNAIKYSKKGGDIFIKFVRISSDGYLLFSLTDYGIGIRKEKIESLFQGMVSSEKGTNSEKGAGLGLMLCHDCITGHGGNIWVESEQEKGAEIYFTLPKAKNP